MRWIIYITLTVGGILLSSSESQLSVILQKEKKMSDEGRNVIFTCLLVTDKIITSSSISSFELYRDGHLVTSKPMHAVRATTFSVNKASDGSYTCVFRMGQRYSIESAPVTLRDKGETTREPQCADSCQYKLVVNDSGTQDTETTGTDWGWSTGVYIVAGVVASLILVMVGIVIYVMRKQGAKAQLQAAASTPNETHQEGDATLLYSELQYNNTHQKSILPKKQHEDVMYAQIAPKKQAVNVRLSSQYAEIAPP